MTASILLLVLIVGIAAAVLPYAHRSLRGDRRGPAVTVAIAAMLAATAVVSVAGELWILAAAWSASTVATIAALALGGGAVAVRRAAAWLLAADIALWVAVALVSLDGPVDAVALLLVAAAIMRCAAPPAHAWLVDSLYAPTPVSAALHGGIVNGGGILVITQYATIAQSDAAIIVLALAAAIAVVIGVLASLVRTDVKGRLVMSTIAQMGFMLLVAALGLLAAALLHLVAHGFYKSSLFLSSSDGIDRRAHDRRAPLPIALSAPRLRVRALAGATLPVATLVLSALALYPGGRGLAELVVLIVIAAAFATAGARVTTAAPRPLHAAVAVAATAGAALAFVVLTSAVSASLALERGETASELGASVAAIIALSAIAALAGLAIVRQWAPMSGAALRLLALGHAVGAPRITRSTVAGTANPRPLHHTMGATT